MAGLAGHADTTEKELLHWENLSPLPDEEGFAGMYAGVSNGVLIAAGGTNFPEGPHWEGGKKKWYDDIYVLKDPQGEWDRIEKRLPRPLAYGVSVSYGDALICIGGEDESKHYNEVFKIEWTGEDVKITELEPLPVPLSRMAGAVLNGVIYITGGQEEAGVPQASADSWSLDMENPDGPAHWEKLEPFPGPARIFPVAAVQDGSFFIISGMELAADGAGSHSVNVPYLKDAYRYTPGVGGNRGFWRVITGPPRPVAAAASPAVNLGQNHFAVLGGLDGSYIKLERWKVPPYSREVLLYHTITDTWVRSRSMPEGTSCVTLPAVEWNGRMVLVSGEKGPAKRTPQVLAVEQNALGHSLVWFDWVVITIYLAAMLGIGFYFSKREKTTRDFFLASGRIPGWAAGLSMIGTTLSAVSFMAIPAVAFATDWVRILNSYSVVIVAPVVVYFFLPFFKRLDVTTAYEYLDLRFCRAVRQLGSAIFILGQFTRIGIVIYLPAIALSAVTGIDVYYCILIMGVFSTVYTVLGGIEAVVWTDVVQVVVLLAGALLCLALITVDLGGVSTLIETGMAYNKFHTFDWRLDPTALVVWVIVTGSIFKTLGLYTSDQSVVQRYLTTKSEKEAARGIWTNLFMLLPMGFLFYGLGTALFAFYKKYPERLSPGRVDEILPWFIVNELPAGVAALVIAGIFSAAMSSLDSSMNSTATAWVNDFYRHFKKDADDSLYLRVAKQVTILVGAVGTGIAMLLVAADVKYIMDQSLIFIGLLGGGLTGIFILGIFTRRCSSTGAVIGGIVGLVLPLLASRTTDLNFFLFGAIGVSSCVVSGYAVSWFIPEKKSDLQGLTIHN